MATVVGSECDGITYKGWYVHPKKGKRPIDVLVKIVEKEQIEQDPSLEKAIKNELKIQEMITNKIKERVYILDFYGYKEVEGDHYFIYEYCQWGDLRNHCNTKNGKHLSEKESKRILQEL